MKEPNMEIPTNKKEELHPVTKEVIEKTEKGELKRGKEDGFYSDTVWELLKGKEVKVTYSDHYNVFITIKPDGSGIIEDGNNDITSEFENWGTGDYESSGVKTYIESIRDALEFVNKVGNAIPSGNLENMGGIKGLVESYVDIKKANDYASNPKKENHNNIPTPEVMSKVETK